MDTSPVCPGSKSNSDFSIKRILSDERKDGSDAPNWLCCTRYQPPRIPRPSSSGGGGARRSGRHARVPFTAAQAAALEAAYARAPYLAPPALRALAAALQLRDDRIKIWFQNRRARERREKSTTITPPHSVPLRPTVPIPWNSQPSAKVFPNQEYVNFSAVSETLHLSRYVASGSFNEIPNSEDSNEDKVEDRPETPLDVDSVEE